MIKKSIYTYTEEEFLNLTDEERETLILRMSKLARKGTSRYKYINEILDEFDAGLYDDIEKLKELYKRLFDKNIDFSNQPIPIEETNNNGFNRKKFIRLVKRQSIVMTLLMIPITYATTSSDCACNLIDFYFPFTEWFSKWLTFSLIFSILIPIIFLPSNIARSRNHPSKGAIIFLNLFFLAIPLWIIAMVWALV